MTKLQTQYYMQSDNFWPFLCSRPIVLTSRGKCSVVNITKHKDMVNIPSTSVRENMCNNSKKRESHVFW